MGELFPTTPYIYGLELLAIIALIFFCPHLLKDKNVTFFRDNTCTCQALVSGYSKSVVIAEMVKLFWYLAQEIELNPRCGDGLHPIRHARQTCRTTLGRREIPSIPTTYNHISTYSKEVQTLYDQKY